MVSRRVTDQRTVAMGFGFTKTTVTIKWPDHVWQILFPWNFVFGHDRGSNQWPGLRDSDQRFFASWHGSSSITMGVLTRRFVVTRGATVNQSVDLIRSPELGTMMTSKYYREKFQRVKSL
eukprot:277538-Hanusia_phi.AAC.1